VAQRFLLGIGPALVLLTCLCVERVPTVPELVQAPGTGYLRTTSEFRLTASWARGESLKCIVSWGDQSSEASESFAQGETISMFHEWEKRGLYWVRAMALASSDAGLSSEWSEFQGIEILSAVSFPYPLVGVVYPISGTEVTFWVTAVGGCESDSFSFQIDFGDGPGDWTGHVASRETAYVVHSFDASIRTVTLQCRVRDNHGTVGSFKRYERDLHRPGAMLWWWVTADWDSAPAVTTPVLATDGGLELAYVGSDDEVCSIYGIDVSTGEEKEDGHSILPDEAYEWISHPAFNTSTRHIIIAKEEGEVYAFKPTLSYEWHWPGRNNELDVTDTEWGNPCLSDSGIYIANIDTIIRGRDTIPRVTKFYKLYDGPNRPVDPAFVVLGAQRVLGAPVMDRYGDLLFVTDSGYLYKLDTGLDIRWRRQLGSAGQMYGPVIGLAGSVICGDADGKVYAVNPDDGLKLWTAVLHPVGEMSIVVGRSAVYVAAENGHVYALDRGSGSLIWDRTVSVPASFLTYPVLTRNGYIFLQDDKDVLYCMSQSDGEKLWDLDCRSYYSPFRDGYWGLCTPNPSPSVTSTGNILVVGEFALYCVSGYEGDGLDTDAPWPKWQHDLHNTGRAGW
jgi:outer membrane protein assembly factor BamB